MSSLDNAIVRLQEIALALSTIPPVGATRIMTAPNYPIEAPPAFPASIAFLSSGEFTLTNASVHHNFPVIAVEFHFSRVNLTQCYQQINAVVIEFPQRLAGDPTLAGTVETIVGGAESRIAYVVRPFQWVQASQTQAPVISQMLVFSVPVKLLKAPKATP